MTRYYSDPEYLINSALDSFFITHDTIKAIKESELDLNEYFNGVDGKGHALSNGFEIIENLVLKMDLWLQKQSDIRKAFILNSNINESSDQLSGFLDLITSEMVYSYLRTNDMCPKAGSIINLLYENNAKINIYNEKDISFPANIASYIMSDKKIYSFINRFSNKVKDFVNLNISEDDIAQYKTNQNILPSSNYSRQIKDFAASEKDFVKLSRIKRKQIIRGKKIIKKGINKFQNIFPIERISSFVKGESFVVEGLLYNWAFKRKENASLIRLSYLPLKGHIPYQLTLLNKSGEEISDVCVCVDGQTPVIDQIIAVSLFIKHDEEDLLKNCNLFNYRSKNIEIVKEMINTTATLTTNEEWEMHPSFFSGEDKIFHAKFDLLVAEYKPIIKKELHKLFGLNQELIEDIMDS